MRHGVSGRKLNRTSSHRLAMFRNMVTSLLQHERIYTTVYKAKELRRWAEWMITLGKRGDLHARRQAMSIIREKGVVHKLFAELAPKYESIAGGYTRIVKVGYRRGDASPMCLIEMVSESQRPVKKVKHKASRPAEPSSPAEENVRAESETQEAQ